MGATGNIGRHVAMQPAAIGEPVRAVARNPEGTEFPPEVSTRIGSAAGHGGHSLLCPVRKTRSPGQHLQPQGRKSRRRNQANRRGAAVSIDKRKLRPRGTWSV